MGDALRVYHGSKAGIEGSIKPIGSSVNDFGRGFYLGDEPSQSLTLICRGVRPTFYTCELDLDGLRVHRFDDGLDWALFVAWNRDMIPEEFRGVYDARFQAIRAENDILIGHSRVLSEAECQTLRKKSYRQRQRAIDEVERIRLGHLHDGLFFQEILARDAKEVCSEA